MLKEGKWCELVKAESFKIIFPPVSKSCKQNRAEIFPEKNMNMLVFDLTLWYTIWSYICIIIWPNSRVQIYYVAQLSLTVMFWI